MKRNLQLLHQCSHLVVQRHLSVYCNLGQAERFAGRSERKCWQFGWAWLQSIVLLLMLLLISMIAIRAGLLHYSRSYAFTAIFFLSFFNAALRHSVYRAGHRYQAGEKSCGRRNSRENGASQWTMSSGGHLGGNSRNGNEHRWQDSTSVRSTAWEVFS